MIILQALCEGGWQPAKEEPESDPENEKKADEEGESEFDNGQSENKMV